MTADDADVVGRVLPDVAAERRRADVQAAARLATAALADRPAGAVGALSATPRLHRDPGDREIQIRSGPSGELAGAELRLLVPAGAPGPRFVKRLAAEVVGWAEDLWVRRDAAAELVAATGVVGETPMGPGVAGARYPRVVAAGVARGWTSDQPFEVVVDLEVLGSGMGWTVDRVSAPTADHLRSDLMERTNMNIREFERLSGLRANRVRGHVEDTALRALAVAGMDLEVALGHLTRTAALHLDLGDGRHRCLLFWEGSLLRCDAATDAAGWSLGSGTLWLEGRVLPETIFCTLVGRRLGEVVSGDGVLPPDAVIVHAEARPAKQLVMWLAVPTTPLPDDDDALGRVIFRRSD